MPISYHYHFQDEGRHTMSGEVLFKHYIKDNTKISNIEADQNRLTIYLGDPQIHVCLIIEPGPPVTVTYRQFHGRRR
jgi:hypothetical protein